MLQGAGLGFPETRLTGDCMSVVPQSHVEPDLSSVKLLDLVALLCQCGEGIHVESA